MTHDYTRKGGVVHTEIMLPPHALPSFSDRSTLWNSVELYEKAGNAQLAREIDAAVSGDDMKVGNPTVAGATVEASVIKEGRAKKVIVYKYKIGRAHV